MLFLGWLAVRLTRLQQTSKKHERSLRNLRISFELLTISFELPTTR